MKCFYHDDADGQCSAYWVARSAIINDSCYYDEKPSFIEINYRRKFPLDIIRSNEQIYLVDYSISADEMRELLKITKNVTWIDHHKTAIEKYFNFEENIRGIRYDGIAASMLTYCYLNHMTVKGEGYIKPFDIKMINYAPLFTKLIADSDVLRFEYGDDTRCFFVGFGAYDFNPLSTEWNKFVGQHDYEHELINQGKIMTIYRDSFAKDYIKLGFQTIFEGKKCFAVNFGYSGVDFFKSLPEGLYDICMPFVFDGTQYIVSMYSKSVDVSEIAKKYGGGGHKMASGFQCKELPFKIN